MSFHQLSAFLINEKETIWLQMADPYPSDCPSKEDQQLAKPLAKRVSWRDQHDLTRWPEPLHDTRLIWQTCDGAAPQEDFSNVLEGEEARKAHKAERLPCNFPETCHLYQLALNKLNFRVPKKRIWQEFQMAFDALEHPDWSISGLVWRKLFFGARRYEEVQLEQAEKVEQLRLLAKALEIAAQDQTTSDADQ